MACRNKLFRFSQTLNVAKWQCSSITYSHHVIRPLPVTFLPILHVIHTFRDFHIITNRILLHLYKIERPLYRTLHHYVYTSAVHLFHICFTERQKAFDTVYTYSKLKGLGRQSRYCHLFLHVQFSAAHFLTSLGTLHKNGITCTYYVYQLRFLACRIKHRSYLSKGPGMKSPPVATAIILYSNVSPLCDPMYCANLTNILQSTISQTCMLGIFSTLFPEEILVNYVIM